MESALKNTMNDFEVEWGRSEQKIKNDVKNSGKIHHITITKHNLRFKAQFTIKNVRSLL